MICDFPENFTGGDACVCKEYVEAGVGSEGFLADALNRGLVGGVELGGVDFSAGIEGTEFLGVFV